MTEATPKLNAAIAAVMAEIERLEKADSNQFGKYKYTSVDDFKDALRPLLAKHGLIFSFTEHCPVETIESHKKTAGGNDATLIAKYVFSFVLRHVEGEEAPPELSTVMLPYTGAQTSGAARSYAIKEWGKSRFMMSSGDLDDADAHKQHDYGQARLSKREAKPLYATLQEEMRKVINETRDSKLLRKWSIDNDDNIQKLPLDWQDTLGEEYQRELETLHAAEQADKANGNGAHP